MSKPLTMKFFSPSLVAFVASITTSSGFLQNSKLDVTSFRKQSLSPTSASFGLSPSFHLMGSHSKNRKVSNFRRMVDDDNTDEELDPLSNGVDSVSWLPSLTEQSSTSVETPDGAEILPFFPLGGIVYTPNSEHVLNIFEPRYRQMYNDILMNGSKRFVVSMSHPTKQGTFAKVGVIFHLDDLKEVSEQTGDQIKYICSHTVVGRVKLHRVLNPEVWDTRETYLKVEGNIIREEEDEDSEQENDESLSSDIYTQLIQSQNSHPAEKSLRDSFKDLVQRQHELEEDVRFTRASVTSLAVSKGDGEDGLWMTIRLWQSFIEQRLVSRQNDMQKDFQEKLIEFLKKEKGIKDGELPSAIGFEDLSPSLQRDVQELQLTMTKQLRPLVLESTLTIQKILEEENHEARLTLLKFFVDAEKKRLDAKKTLQGMFKGDSTAVTTESTPDDIEDNSDRDEDESNDFKSEPKRSIIIDEEDAFQ